MIELLAILLAYFGFGAPATPHVGAEPPQIFFSATPQSVPQPPEIFGVAQPPDIL